MNSGSGAPHPQLDLGFVRRGGRTVLDRRLFGWPFVLTRTFALDRHPAHLLTTVVQTSSGALHGGDRVRQRFHVGAGAAVHCTTQGATPVHRADPGASTRERVEIAVEAGGYFEYLPEARILFPGAAIDQAIEVDCAADATVLVGDAFTLHDPAGLARHFDRLHAATTLRRCGEAVLIDHADLAGSDLGPEIAHTAFGSLWLLRPGSAADHVALAEALSKYLGGHPGLYAAASPLAEAAGLGIRLAGRDLRHVRHGLQIAWSRIRLHCQGAPPTMRHRETAEPPRGASCV